MALATGLCALVPLPFVGILPYLFADVPLAFMCFALARSTHSRFARLLTGKLMQHIAPYTFAIYLIHYPIIFWARFIRMYKIRYWFWHNPCVPIPLLGDDGLCPTGNSTHWDDDDGAAALFGFSYASAECEQNGGELEEKMRTSDFEPFDYIGIFCVSLIAAVRAAAATNGVH